MSRQKWCCCLPLSWSVYASTFICWVTQLALSILFITQGSYPSYGTIGVCCMFFIIAIVGIMRQNTCMLRFYQIYTTLLLIGLIGIIGWMCYITVRGDDNVFYDNCVADKYYDNGCKGDARRIAILAIIFALVGLAAVMTALRSVHTYIDYIVMKRMARPDPCCQAPPPAPLPQPGMNVNVVVQPQTGGYPVSYVYAAQPGVHYQQQPTVPPAYQPVYPTYPAQTPGGRRCSSCSRFDRKTRDAFSQPVQIVQLYGMTEAGLLIFMTPPDNDRLDSVGLPLPGVDPDGWFPSGDLARVDADGFVSIVGRTKEMIKVRGWQVSPYELEEAIKTNIFGVEDVAIIGVEVEEGLRKSGCTTAATVPQSIGQRPYAFVVGPECDPEAVKRFVEENFVSYKHLAGVAVVDELPRTASGKLCRHKLLEFPRTLDE
ncbi:unnamed protein product, partial [Mesorhabditis spiculigera]